MVFLQNGKRKEFTADWKKIHNEKHYNLYSSTNILQVNKSGRDWQGMWHVQGTEIHAGL
jgi:hypothetical protein